MKKTKPKGLELVAKMTASEVADVFFPESRGLTMECSCGANAAGTMDAYDAQVVSAIFYDRHPAPDHRPIVHYPTPTRIETPIPRCGWSLR